MKSNTCWYVYVALLLLIFLVVLFPYKEGFDYNPFKTTDVSGASVQSIGKTTGKTTDVSGATVTLGDSNEPQPYSFTL
jgi:hypothetical protein